MYRIGPIYVLFVLCVTETLGLSEEMQELIDNLHNSCVEETGTSDDLITNARKGDFSDDEKFKCYFKCLFDQMGCMTDDGKVDADAVVALMPPEIADQVEPVVKKCKNEVGSNGCETAWLTNKCYQAANPDVYFLP